MVFFCFFPPPIRALPILLGDTRRVFVSFKHQPISVSATLSLIPRSEGPIVDSPNTAILLFTCRVLVNKVGHSLSTLSTPLMPLRDALFFFVAS
jgi:hypothetical protein